ncbi:MAG: inositol monophosphatase family protein [Porticoccaceae bacterium]|nr:inositol monophosphatase family protein [Porticoccaceae bacterium]
MQPMVNIALRAARLAGEMIVKSADSLDSVKVDEKGRHDFVTEVDKRSEETIIYHIQKAFPDHRFLCEESGVSGNLESDVEWIIDPLDGTTNFIRGIPHVAISIACRIKGRIEHAIILEPFKQEEFTASRGDGARLNGRRIRVSGRASEAGALYATGIPFSSPSFEYMDNYLKCMHEFADNSSGIRRMGAASLDLAYVAAGRMDAFWEMYLKPWDIAAGALLVREAGGMVSDFQGGEKFLDNGHIVACTPKLFKPTLKVLAKNLGNLK